MRTKSVFLVWMMLLALLIVPSGRGAARLGAFAGAKDVSVQGVPAPTMPVLNVARLQVYQSRIVRAAGTLPARTSLAELLRLVMQDADTDKDATDRRVDDDYRAAVVAITFYVNGWPLTTVTPEAKSWPQAPRRAILLRGRRDLALHFTVSAVIAGFAGTPIAAAAGLYKEMEDARGTSGFSFSDLAADRAGTMFGEMATRSLESARRLQSHLNGPLVEKDIMPDIAGLPDNLSQAEFTRRFGGVGEPAYNQLVEEINRRVAALPLFQ